MKRCRQNTNPIIFIITRDFYYYVTKYLLKKIDRNISISKCISELFVNFKLTEEYFPVIYHGLEVAPVNKAGLSSFKKASPQLVIVGRLEEYKGHRYALEAMPAILEKYPAAKLLLLGDGSYRSSLAVLVAEAGIAESVLFLGFQKDPLSFISASEIVIIPSLFEPFGLVFIEAMALRKPIAAFDVPAGNELLNTDTAALVPRKDSNALAEKILVLLDDQHLRETIAANAYAEYRERFTTEVMVRNTAGFLSLPENKLIQSGRFADIAVNTKFDFLCIQTLFNKIDLVAAPAILLLILLIFVFYRKRQPSSIRKYFFSCIFF